jgi:hypothetical protein
VVRRPCRRRPRGTRYPPRSALSRQLTFTSLEPRVSPVTNPGASRHLDGDVVPISSLARLGTGTDPTWSSSPAADR